MYLFPSSSTLRLDPSEKKVDLGTSKEEKQQDKKVSGETKVPKDEEEAKGTEPMDVDK